MKFIHCADIHLGSKIEARLPKDKSDERRAEVRASFNRMVEYAKRENVTAVLLSGDVFDSDRPLKKDKEFFYSVVRNNPQIDFLYLRGNHDGEESYTLEMENLKTFSGGWTAYTYGDVCIYGIEISANNALSLYSSLKTDPDSINIVMLHGQIGSASGADKINLSKLRNKNIDYLALGHIHSHSSGKLDERGTYCYSGCLEGRGFDETGKKGFVLVDTEGGISFQFIPFACRTIEEVEISLSGTKDTYEALSRINGLKSWGKDDLVRLILTGETEFSNPALASDLETYLKDGCYFISVKDRTVKKYTISEYEGDLSLKGEFVRSVLSDGTLDERTKSAVIAVGLRALSGGEAEL